MTRKSVHFVRHGESLTNSTGFHHGPDVELTPRGVQQAELVAERLRLSPIERIIVSPYERTMKTAVPIANALKQEVEYSALFVERRGPSEMRNRHGRDPKVQQIWKTIREHAHIPGWHYSDEENFDELLVRARNALFFLESLPNSHVLVVSHGLFMKMIFAYVLLGDNLDGRVFWDRFIQAENVENTGIMRLDYTDNYWNTAKFWKFISWNDHAHLSGK